MLSSEKPYQRLEATAYWTAAVRAGESERKDRLLYDPWAAALAGETGRAWITPRSPESVTPILLRTRYFDDFLQRIAAEQHIRQVVLLAAGLDTRAFRLHWPPDTRLFELDQATVLDYKEEILEAAHAQAACRRQALAADLATPWAQTLEDAGFDRQLPAVWLLEGFLFYLPNDVSTQLLDTVTALSAPGSWLGCDVVNEAMLVSPLTHDWLEMQAQAGAPWIGTMDDPVAFFAARGWQATLTQAGAADADYGRWPFPVIPTALPGIPHNWFVTACYRPVDGKGKG